MSLEKGLKLKAPKVPSGLDDKEITKAITELTKALTPLVAAIGGVNKAIGPALDASTKLVEAAKKKFDDKNSDAKTKAAAKELYTEAYKVDQVITGLV